ncbi:hypothetical protein IFM89_000659 [Coptis chinensis]|uniref:Pentatricopeptide repeat-containing protein n=1 Tax=Coptis chinensis TaxID=261450 RepID=A0A835M3W8_9MAGN|nr:hypothetical protein IFM89_000659 [Coptis chinensis]
MIPSEENFGSLVDLFSRNGFLEEAKHVLEVMPFMPWPVVWRSILNGCRIHGNRNLGEWASKHLLQLVPKNDAAYVLFSSPKCLNDGTPEVRDASFSVMAAIAKSVGMRPLERSLEKLDEVRKKKLAEMIGGSGGGLLPSTTTGFWRCSFRCFAHNLVYQHRFQLQVGASQVQRAYSGFANVLCLGT